MKYKIFYNKHELTKQEEKQVEKIGKCIKYLIDNYLSKQEELKKSNYEFVILFPLDACYLQQNKNKLIVLNSVITKERNIHYKIAHEIAHALLNHKSLNIQDKKKYQEQEQAAKKLVEKWLQKLKYNLIKKNFVNNVYT